MDPIAPSLARLQQVQVRYRDHTALHGIDLQVRAGQVLALLGRNGAGKSTAISVLLGLRRADAGQVELLGGDPQQRASRIGLGVMLQSTSLPPMLRVDELVVQASACYPDPMPLQEVLQRAGLQALARRRYGQLSGGQQRAVQFAIALCGRPRVLFLDEPTTGLDIQARQAMWQAIRQLVAEGCGALLTTHYLEEAEALAQQVVVLEQGRVLADAPLSELRLADRPGAASAAAAGCPLRTCSSGRACSRCSATASTCSCWRARPSRWWHACWPPTRSCASWKYRARRWPTPSST